MKRILLLGLSPLPTENETCTLAPGKRTWQFTRPLLDMGHRICLVCCRHLAAYQEADLPPIHAEEHGNLVYYSVEQPVFENTAWLQRIHDHFEPDCIIGATVFPSFIAVRLTTDVPIWADLFGHVMAEAQTKSFVFNDNYYISKLWKQEKTILDRADVFSVVSTPQAYATIGELGTRFRLNRATTGYSFIRVIPCSINEHVTLETPGTTSGVLRGKHVPDDAFIILWSGGYNTWTDIESLFTALESVLRLYPNVYFVSTGGRIASHDELTYGNFLNRIESSEYRDRYVMLGWIPFNEVPLCVKESNVGVNIDLYSYEGILGSRNRLMDWMQAGLPVVTSELCELSEAIRQRQLGLTFRPENPGELTEVLIRAIEHPADLKEMTERARRYVMAELTAQVTTEPLVKWVDDPHRAPDANERVLPPEIDPGMHRFGLLARHYLASIRNNVRSHGLGYTFRWLAARTPGIRRFVRS
ncbi:glycosyltransferase [bacterium]|nr:glycosyltransferase [candidate division CSSED10-310 bacterium]